MYWRRHALSGSIGLEPCGNGGPLLLFLRRHPIDCRPGILIVWDKVTAGVARRWAILATLIIIAYFIVESFSNRSAFHVFISYLTFNADTSYMRVHIWNYGMQSVMQHPIFGVGLNDWERPIVDGWQHR